MLMTLYRSVLRLPHFRGRTRLENLLRRALRPPLFPVAGLRFQLDPLEWLQIEMLSGIPSEPATMALFDRLLKPGDTVIDVGCHVGFHALYAARRVGPAGLVIAVDPQPYNCERVMTNAEANKLAKVMVICAAAGSKPGFALLRQQSATDKARLTLAGVGVNDTGLTFEVPVVTLDEVVGRRGLERVELLKIDVEGYEAEVLAGAHQTLARTNNIVLEILPDHEVGQTASILDVLKSAGFSFRAVSGSTWKLGERLAENNLWASRAAN